MKNENVMKMAEVIRRARQELRSGLILPEETATALHKAGYRKIDGETSDVYHTYNELYHHRTALFTTVIKEIDKIAAEFGVEEL